MSLTWVREESPIWDAHKRRIVGGAPEDAFVLPFADGDPVPGEWWSVRVDAEGGKGADGAVVAYGRLDISWGGDAEILLAVDPGRQGQGVGSMRGQPARPAPVTTPLRLVAPGAIERLPG